MNKRYSLPVLLLAVAFGGVGCGQDDPAPEPPKQTFGAGLGKSYNDMLDQARQGADAANQHLRDTEQRARPTE